MKRTIILIVVAAIALISIAVFFALKNNHANNFPGTTSSPGLPNVPLAAPVSAPPPADAPGGGTFSLQGTNGIVTVKNFYQSASYFPSLDELALVQNATYTIWYERSISHFDIWFAPGRWTAAGEADAVRDLTAQLGVSTGTLCGLSVSVVFSYDNGNTHASRPPSACTSGSFQ